MDYYLDQIHKHLDYDVLIVHQHTLLILDVIQNVFLVIWVKKYYDLKFSLLFINVPI